jgi:hypothetical protein
LTDVNVTDTFLNSLLSHCKLSNGFSPLILAPTIQKTVFALQGTYKIKDWIILFEFHCQLTKGCSHWHRDEGSNQLVVKDQLMQVRLKGDMLKKVMSAVRGSRTDTAHHPQYWLRAQLWLLLDLWENTLNQECVRFLWRVSGEHQDIWNMTDSVMVRR